MNPPIRTRLSNLIKKNLRDDNRIQAENWGCGEYDDINSTTAKVGNLIS